MDQIVHNKCLNEFIHSGKFNSEYVTKEEKTYIENNTKHVFIFSTLRNHPDDYHNLSTEAWPTFPIFALIKS